nr:putative reverse transcriptase domain-containing protein [Tanacetum cinerariifolium]
MLYGRKCRAPICWDQVGERVIEGAEMIEMTNAKIAVAKEKLKEARTRLVVHVFNLGDYPIAYLNKEMAFLTVYNKFKGGKGKVILVLVIRVMLLLLGKIIQADMQGLLNATIAKVKDTWQDPRVPDGQAVQSTI